MEDTFVLYYDLVDYDETFYYEEEIVSGKAVSVRVEIERQFDANVVLWGSDGKPADWDRLTAWPSARASMDLATPRNVRIADRAQAETRAARWARG